MDDQKHQDFSTEGTTPVFSDAVPTGPSPVAPPAPVMLLPSGVNVVKKGSGWPKIKWGKGAKAVLAGSILALILLVGGVFAATKLTKKPTNPPAKAWDGYGLSATELQKRSEVAKNFLPNIKPYSSFPTKDFYNTLVAKAPDAEVVSFREQSIGMVGTAYMKYVDSLGKSFVFSRIEGIPYPDKGLIRLWITRDEKSYEPVGMVEFTYEPKIKAAVGYSVFASEKDLRMYKKLIFSYDSAFKIIAPESVAITLNF